MSTKVTPAAEAPAATRERLLRAAVEVFQEQGYEGTRVSEVARRAGLTTGAIYANFRSKRELLQEVVALGSGHVLAQMADRRRAGASYRDLIEALGSGIARRARDDDRALLLEAFAAARRDPELAADLRRTLQANGRRLGSVLDGARADGDVADDLDTAAFVRLGQALALGYYLLESVGLDGPTTAAWDALIRRLVAAVEP